MKKSIVLKYNKDTKRWFDSILNIPQSIDILQENGNRYSYKGMSFTVPVDIYLDLCTGFIVRKRGSDYWIETTVFHGDDEKIAHHADTDPKLTEHQQEQFDAILDDLKSGKHCCLDAAAGTGKTFMLCHIVEALRDEAYKVQVCSTTHKACAVISEQIGKWEDVRTIHSYLGLRQKIDYKTGAETFEIDKEASKIEKGTIVVVDEASMINKELFVHLKNAIVEHKIVVLFIGDSYQLPPVNEDISYALRIPNKYELTEIVRHDNSIILAGDYCRRAMDNNERLDIKTLAASQYSDIHHIKDSEFDGMFLDNLKKNKKVLFVGWTNKCVDDMAHRMRVQLGYDPLYLSPGERITLTNPCVKNNAVVIPNNVDLTITRVTSANIEGIPLQKVYVGDNYFHTAIDLTEFNEKLKYLAKLAKIDGSWRKYYSVKEKVIPVGFSFACTVHKSQGSTVDEVFVDAGDIMRSDIASRLMYVGITRTSSRVFIKY